MQLFSLGYVIDGALKVWYPGGKEETINAGEVFYWPAPHTGVVEKNVKFIDISPDWKFIPVINSRRGLTLHTVA